jgi:hypothetical protein
MMANTGCGLALPPTPGTGQSVLAGLVGPLSRRIGLRGFSVLVNGQPTDWWYAIYAETDCAFAPDTCPSALSPITGETR